MGPLRVSNVLRPDNRVAAGPWVGWAHGGVCSVCGRAQWPWRVLRTAGGCGVRGYFWARVRWVFGSSGVGAFCVRLWVYHVCYEVDNSPLFNFNRIFPPFSRSVPKPCAETSYLRVQCLCGRADVWGAREVGATILDVFGYGLPTESGVGSQRRYCCCRGREVGHPSENGMNSLGKFAFIPPFSLKIQCRHG